MPSATNGLITVEAWSNINTRLLVWHGARGRNEIEHGITLNGNHILPFLKPSDGTLEMGVPWSFMNL